MIDGSISSPFLSHILIIPRRMNVRANIYDAILTSRSAKKRVLVRMMSHALTKRQRRVYKVDGALRSQNAILDELPV